MVMMATKKPIHQYIPEIKESLAIKVCEFVSTHAIRSTIEPIRLVRYFILDNSMLLCLLYGYVSQDKIRHHDTP